MAHELRQGIELDTVQVSGSLARVETLISTVVHQLRNPLNNMSMRLELLRTAVSEGGLRHIDKLRQDINRLDESLEAFANFICPPKLKPVDFDIGEVLRQLRTEVENDRIQVELKIDSALPVIRADREMIHKALINVMMNGTESMPTGGTLVLAAACDDSSISITVTDSGQGIPPENSERVFDLYFTTKNGGKGMGLPNALRLIELNGGTMTIKSSPGRGTSCRIKLPILPDN